MTDPKTLSVLAIVATLGSVLTVTALEYRAAMATAAACEQCLEASHGPGACCVVCGRCDQCQPRASPEMGDAPPPDDGSGHGSWSADRGGLE